MDWALPDTGYKFRALRLLDPPMEGWDVYALQSALNATINGAALALDGAFGASTDMAVNRFQRAHNLVVDGVAGTATQGQLARLICRTVGNALGLAQGIPYSGAEKESSLWLGNYTAPYPNGTRDGGVMQRNYSTPFTPSPQQAFDVPASIQLYGRTVGDRHGQYVSQGVKNRRAWELACGSWNRPAYADALADGKEVVKVGDVMIDLSPSAPARVALEDYMADATAYCRWR